MTLYEKVQSLCKSEGFEISNLGEKLNIGITKGTISKWKTGATPRASTIRAIADYFGVDAEYLTDDSITTPQYIHDNHGIIGTAHAAVTIVNSDGPALTDQEMELIGMFRKLTVMQQAQVLVKTAELIEG